MPQPGRAASELASTKLLRPDRGGYARMGTGAPGKLQLRDGFQLDVSLIKLQVFAEGELGQGPEKVKDQRQSTDMPQLGL